MKRVILILFLFQGVLNTSFGQYYKEIDTLYNDQLIDTGNYSFDVFGLEINEFQTNSGFKESLGASLSIKGAKRSLEFGFYLDRGSYKLSGLNVTHKYFLQKLLNEKLSGLNPHLFYKFIYRVTFLSSPLSPNPEIVKSLSMAGKARYASIEHYIGFGFEYHLNKKLYINTNLGVGRYFGSIQKPDLKQPNQILYQGSDGWSHIFKVGFGYTII